MISAFCVVYKPLFLFFCLADRDVQHNISFSAMIGNQRGAVSYISAGEVNPAVTLEWNQIRGNGNKLYGNFTSAEAAVMMDVQNTQNIFFRVRLQFQVLESYLFH